MQRLFIFITVALLAVAPLGGLSSSAQEVADEDWDNVARPTLGAPLGALETLLETLRKIEAEQQSTTPPPTDDVNMILEELAGRGQTGYAVSFLERLAHIPEIETSELMAVYVRSGEFVLDNMGPSPFIVVPGGEDGTITMMDFADDGVEVHYTLNGDMPCAGLCEVTPPDTNGAPRIALQLLPGDWVIAPAAELCVWCLLNTNVYTDQSVGVLYVYPLLADDEFAWIQSWDDFETADQGAPTSVAVNLDQNNAVKTEPLSDALTWAYFNPSANCRSP